MSNLSAPPPPAQPSPSSQPPPNQQRAEAVARLAALASKLLDAIEVAVVGKRSELNLILAGLIAGGHVLLDDVPGVAKTLTARSLATAAGLDFARVQFTPDVLPSDITGVTALDLNSHEPVFRPGPIFAQLVLADEINRAPAKTQAALLEAMQERRVTMDGTSHQLPDPFLVIATQNPVESEGTYPLPEAQLDRFILRTSIGYPDHAAELELLNRRITRRSAEATVAPAIDTEAFRALQRATEHIHVHELIVDYITAIVRASREHRDLELGASPRGSLALLGVSRSHALLNGRDFVTPDDVRAVALPTLSHRVILTDEAWARRVAPDDVMREVVDSIPTPTWQ